uniref:mitogen-activated protein kinase kinase n=1 Tax=Acrobeloides nanus TaxID=290746 RepID=A0A914CAF0_9BILA
MMDCPNIVQFYGIGIQDINIYSCMEVMDISLKDLYKEIHSTRQAFPEDIIGCVGASVLNALVACKAIEVIHRDVKPANVLINLNGYIKLGDFGESRILENSAAKSSVGTISYWPPESFTKSDEYDVRFDVWSLGITLTEISYGKHPLIDQSTEKDYAQVQNIISRVKGDMIQGVQ